MPLVVIEISSRPSGRSALSAATTSGRSRRTVGSPPVSRIFVTPARTNMPASTRCGVAAWAHAGLQAALEHGGPQLRLATEGCSASAYLPAAWSRRPRAAAPSGHAVDAAQVAALGERDAQVVVPPREPVVEHLRRVDLGQQLAPVHGPRHRNRRSGWRFRRRKVEGAERLRCEVGAQGGHPRAKEPVLMHAVRPTQPLERGPHLAAFRRPR
eukprot:scaffold66011_cov54-Phaeocystis_antarctica.AAC.2